jgi:hypothetical protein
VGLGRRGAVGAAERTLVLLLPFTACSFGVAADLAVIRQTENDLNLEADQ